MSAAEERWRTSTLAFCYRFYPEAIHPIEGSTEFDPYPYQKGLWRCMDRGGRPVVLKARQIGISAAVMLQKVRCCVGKPDNSVVVVADVDKSAIERIRDARHFFTTCKEPEGGWPPDWPTLTVDNQHVLGWSNGSRILALPASPKPGRGFAVSDLVLDEFAWWPWQQSMWQAINPTTSLGGNITIVSTPAMEGDLFDDRWKEAQSERSGWTPFFLPWQECPAYNERWAEAKRSELTEAEFAQEYDGEFGKASDAVFGADHIANAQILAAKPYLRTSSPKHTIGGDLAGKGRDRTVLLVLDVSTEPARLVDKWDVGVAPAQVLQDNIDRLANQYGAKPWLDSTGIGWGIAENVECDTVNVTFTTGTTVTGTKLNPNIPAVKLISNLVLAIEHGQIAIPAEYGELLLGLKAYRWKQGTDKKTRNADWVDALALAWWSVSRKSSYSIAMSVADYGADDNDEPQRIGGVLTGN